MRDIQYKSIACGPAGSFQPGDKRHDVPDGEAATLVNGGYATYADMARPTLSTPVREQAIPTLGEQAVSPAQPQHNTPRRGR
jgi:hypothetical protein